MNPANVLLSRVAQTDPDVYRNILYTIQPHRIESVERLLNKHLQNVNLQVFNRHRTNIAPFLLRFVRAIRKNFPEPGTAFGIQLTCRITKADTQDTLDSKHLRAGKEDPLQFNVVKALLYELNIFTIQSHVLELATRRTFATVFARDYTIEQLMQRLPQSCRLERGKPFNKGTDARGRFGYLNTFRFVLVQHSSRVIKVVYRSSRDLNFVLKRLDPARVVALSDIRHVFKKCGIVAHYFNLLAVLKLQLFCDDEDSVREHDLRTVVKYQCQSGEPLPLNRDGLAKNKDRSPIDVLSFEAPKRNYVRLMTTTEKERRYPVETSADKIFFGQQFNEGTGYQFEICPKE